MSLRTTKGEKAFAVVDYAILIFLVLICLYPLYYVLLGSVSDPIKMMQNSGLLLVPFGFHLDAYKLVFENPMIPAGYVNTLFYLSAGTVVNMILTTLGAYALSRKNVMFRDFFMFAIVFTMLFQGGMIPTYLVVKNLGMIDSWVAMVLPRAVIPMYLIIMRTVFAAVPESLIESARMEGAGELTILSRIVLPVSMAVVAVVILFYSVYHWNTWFLAMLYMRTRAKYPLQLILREILIANSTSNMTTSISSDDKEFVSVTIKYATIIVATVPILCVYPFLQKYFVTGVMIGAIKG